MQSLQNNVHFGYMLKDNAIHACIVPTIYQNAKLDGILPTYQDHRPILHVLQLAHPSMFLLLPTDCQTNDFQ